MRPAFLALVAGTLFVWGCAPAPNATPAAATAPPSSTVSRQPSPVAAASPAAVASPGPVTRGQAALDAALGQAAEHLGVSATQLKVEQMEERQWPDASVGCPQPGQLYAQVV